MTALAAPLPPLPAGEPGVQPAARQLALPLPIERVQGFDSFVAGANAQAVHHLSTGPLLSAQGYLWGEAGTGKSHLLAAAAARVRAGGGVVEWLGPQRSLPWPPPEHAEQAPLFVIDDCDALSPEQQHAAFSLLVQAPAIPAAVLAAGRKPPVDLPLREDLRTRLAQGLIFQIEPLDDDGTRHVLTAEAHRRGLVLAPEVSHYLVTRFARDLKSLMSLLDRLDQFALEQKRALSIPLLKRMLEERRDELAP